MFLGLNDKAGPNVTARKGDVWFWTISTPQDAPSANSRKPPIVTGSRNRLCNESEPVNLFMTT